MDSATRALADTIHDWLANLLPSATTFACQSGYYRFDALDNFSSSIEKLLSSGGRFDLVIGANEERLSAPDLESTLELVGLYIPTAASFTLVGASNGLFHPKTYYVELANGSRHAAVGSANLTGSGIGHNVEACILLDGSVDDPATLDAARDAILAWRHRASAGATDARPVTPEYIRELTAERIIEPIPVERPPTGTRATKTGKSSFPPLKRIAGIPVPRSRRTTPTIASPGAAGVTLPGATVSFPPWRRRDSEAPLGQHRRQGLHGRPWHALHRPSPESIGTRTSLAAEAVRQERGAAPRPRYRSQAP